MKYLALVLIFVSYSALACWKVEGSFAVDGETYKFHQKVEHDKDYKFPGAHFILSMKLKKIDKKNSEITYKIEEKKGLKLVLITEGEDEVIVGNNKEIYAKGEEGQPNSIIILKLTDI